jgi:hypothetical protein
MSTYLLLILSFSLLCNTYIIIGYYIANISNSWDKYVLLTTTADLLQFIRLVLNLKKLFASTGCFYFLLCIIVTNCKSPTSDVMLVVVFCLADVSMHYLCDLYIVPCLFQFETILFSQCVGTTVSYWLVKVATHFT